MLTLQFSFAYYFDCARYLSSLNLARVYFAVCTTSDEFHDIIVVSDVFNLLEFHLRLERQNVTLHDNTFLLALPLVELEAHIVLQLKVVAKQPAQYRVIIFLC